MHMVKLLEKLNMIKYSILHSNAIIAGIGYTFGNLLIKGINFLVLPIFSRLMTEEEFGIYNVFLSFDSIMIILVSMALYTSIKNANYEFKGFIDSYVSSLSILFFLNSLFFIVFGLFFENQINGILGIDFYYWNFLIVHSFGGSLIALYNARISLNYSYKKYIIIASINSIGNVLLSLLFILYIFESNKAFGRIFAITINSLILIFYICRMLYSSAKPKINLSYWLYGLKYSLPIMPHGISQVLLSHFSRIIINKLSGAAAAGVYALAGTFNLVMIIIANSIIESWSTWFYEKMEIKCIDVIKRRAFDLTILFCLFEIVFMAISPELIILIGGSKYIKATSTGILLISSGYFIFLYSLIVIGEYYTKNTLLIMIGTCVSAILSIFLNFKLIPIFGYIGAAYATISAYIFYLLIHYFFSKYCIGFAIVPFKLLVITIFISLIYSFFLINNLDSIGLRYLSCSILSLSLFLVYFLRRNVFK